MPCPQDPALLQAGITVDHFYQSASFPQPIQYFCLTHPHADHFKGIRANQTIYCTQTTAQLLQFRFPSIKFQFCCLTFYQPYQLTAEIIITALPAFHCDGSAMFHFQLPQKVTLLYTGDFRWHAEHRDRLASFPADRLYYDATLAQLSEARLPGYPSQAATLAALQTWLQAYHSDPYQGPLYFNANILGVEPLLRQLWTTLDFYCALSPSLAGSYRGAQLQYLLPAAMWQPQHPEQKLIVLAHRHQEDRYHQDNFYWLIPTATRFFVWASASSFDSKG